MGMLVSAREAVAQYVGSSLYKAAQLTTTVPTDGAAGTAASVGRVAISWTAGASDGQITATVTIDNVPAGTYRGLDLYDATSGGTRQGWVQIADATFTAQGRLNVTLTVPVTVAA